MSRRKYESYCQAPVMANTMPFSRNNCCCNFPTLVILILIILQFGKKDSYHDYDDDCDDEHEERRSKYGIDNGILFIIALFYLACCNPCR